MRKLRDVVETKSTKEMKWVASGVYNPVNKEKPPKQIKFPKLISILIPIFLCLSCTDCASTKSVTFLDACTDEWVHGEMTGTTIGVAPLVLFEGRTYVLGPNSTHAWGWQCYHLYPRGLNRTYYNPEPEIQERDVKDSI
jgi:hypothetical protein